VAARDTTHGKPATTECTVTLERLDGIRGAAWIITARGWKQRRKRHLVAAHEQNKKSAHGRTLRGLPTGGDARSNGDHVGAQPVERGSVGFTSSADGEVYRRPVAQRWQQLRAHEFAKAALETIAIYRGSLMTGNHNSHAWKFERGSGDPHIEMHGPNTLPLSNDSLYVGAPRQSIATRKGKSAVMRLRTCSGA
jgi:hypothetical protein